MSLTKASYSMITGAPVNALDFGAVGDGVADDTAAIQAAIDYSVPRGATLYIPSGQYKVTSTLNINYSAVYNAAFRIQGNSARGFTYLPIGSVFLFQPTTLISLFSINGRAANSGGANSGSPLPCEFNNISVVGNSSALGAIDIVRATNIAVNACAFIEFTNTNSAVVRLNSIGAVTPYTGNVLISDCHWQTTGGACVALSGDANLGTITYVRLRDCQMLDQKYGVYVNWAAGSPYTQSVAILNSDFEGSTQNDIYSQGAANNWQINGCWFETAASTSNPRINILGSANASIVIRGNTFQQALPAAGQSVIYIQDANGVEAYNNFSGVGTNIDRFSIDLVNVTNANCEPFTVSTGTVPYPVRLNNYVMQTGRMNDLWSTALPSGSGKFVGISSGDGFPGGTVCTVLSEYNKVNALVHVNFKATITTKSASGTNCLIGVLPFGNNGKADVLFPVYTENVTGTGPFYAKLLVGGTTATIYDATNAAVNYQTACSVGSVFYANFSFATQS